ncbi:MAG: nucleotidyltransferase family protein [Acidobacteriota bacterium]|nr:nucleotidyltransferase family protein [Acidobacteriota bacterium]
MTKAFLLAAGLGTRLRPLTDHTPKCLVPIHGEPLLSIWLSFCERAGVNEVLINTHHLAGMVNEWAKSQKSLVRIRLFHERELLGSGGTIAANRDFVGDNEDFYVFYADNLVSTDLAGIRKLHASHSGVLTIGLFRSPKPQDCGVVTLNPMGKVLEFEEKPPCPKSNLASAGVFIARRSLFDYLHEGRFADLGKDVLPALAGRMWGQVLDGFMLDIGTRENYEKALLEWPRVAAGTAPGGKEGFRF